ncbi:MAG TPA: uroporphyrinogen-III C-methyltransferase [Burkholderiales bacterium]|nr:uroporphyrinogen-III C-methyltransferase [Burkholderiales bacterium]
MNSTGTVYLVGAGPGAPDLLTLRAVRLLERADIVFHDALIHPDTLALAARARKVAVGKRCSGISTEQRFINRSLVEAAHKHACVVRLKGGDPMVFGRAQEEIDALRSAGISFEVVPGVTAALAAAADLSTSLTRRGLSRSLVFVTPRVAKGEGDSHWVRAAMAADTVALYMGAGEGAAIAQALQDAGMPATTPAVSVQNASLASRRVRPTSLAGLGEPSEASRGDGPAILLLGEVFGQLLQAPAQEASNAGAQMPLPRTAAR